MPNYKKTIQIMLAVFFFVLATSFAYGWQTFDQGPFLFNDEVRFEQSVDFQGTVQNHDQSVPVNIRVRRTIAQLNTNASEILPAIHGLGYRLIDCKAIAYGGPVVNATTIDIRGTQSGSVVKLAAFAQANLTQSAMVVAGGTGGTILADGASFTACDDYSSIFAGITGLNCTNATGVDFIITYVAE